MRPSIMSLAVTAWLVCSVGLAQDGTSAPLTQGDYAQNEFVQDDLGLDGGGADCPPCATCGFGIPCGVYSRVEYLVWGSKGMRVPALVTTSAGTTERENAGVLGEDGTAILFGTGTINSQARNGARVVVGTWLDGCGQVALEGEYFGFHDLDRNFHRSSNGVRILARPFFDVLQGTESSSLVAFPSLIEGRVDVDAVTRLQGAGLRTVCNLYSGEQCSMGWFTGCQVQTHVRHDLIVGYRFLQLDDDLSITERETSLDPVAEGSFFIHDRFRSENQFHGLDLGTALHYQRGCWSLDLLSKVALGNVRSVARIDGNTEITEDGDTENNVGGLLAQRTNIGEYRNDDFAMAPELGFTVGYQVNPCWRMTAGYTFLYWSRVFRAGDQIDLDVNTDLLPPEEDEVTTSLRPAFRGFAADDFWAQGLTLGLEGNW